MPTSWPFSIGATSGWRLSSVTWILSADSLGSDITKSRVKPTGSSLSWPFQTRNCVSA